MKKFISICAAFMLSACGGGGGSTESEPFVVPARYLPVSYAPFATTHSADGNLEGTWLVFMNGGLVSQDLIGVNGSNFREELQLYSRYLVRLKKRTDQTDSYYINSCGPIEAQDDAVTQSSGNIEIPFYTGPCCSVRYQMTVVDPVTIQASNLTGGRTYNSGRNVSWNLSFTLKRISDNPLHAIAQFHDNKAASTVESGCPYESDGTYIQTENDSKRQNFREDGRYYAAFAYPTSALDNDFATYSPLASITQYVGHRIQVSHGGNFYTTDQSGTTAVADRTSRGNATSVDARVFQQPPADPQVDVSLDVTP